MNSKTVLEILISFKGLWIAVASVKYLCMHIFQFFYVKFNITIYKSSNTLKAEILLGNKNYHPHNSLSGCCCYLLICFNPLKTPWYHLQWVKPLSQLQNYRTPHLKLRTWCPKSFKGTSLPIFNKIIQHKLPVIGDRQLKDIFSTVWINLHAWLNLLNLGTNDINSGTNNLSCRTSVYLFSLN
jgi:hypothetical protein